MKQASILLSAFSLFLLPASGTAQGVFPDTIWMPVIFYDYHADSTNPDFRACASGFTPGMVDTVLGRDRKPVPVRPVCSTACAGHFSEWFRVSGTGGSDTASHFICDSIASSMCDSNANPWKNRWYWTSLKPYMVRSGEYTGGNYNSSYAMRNVIIYDSLPFVHRGSMVYEYSNNAFFNLDNRGYGTEPSGSGHNNGFAMELHTSFTYRKSLVYNFGGAGDLWVFMNGRLVVDNGGAHGTMNNAVSLDSVAARLGLLEGGTYPLDVFYAQRTVDSSGIRITFTIVTAQPCKIGIYVSPNDTIYAGDTLELFGKIFNPNGSKNLSLSDSIRWTIDSSTYRASDTLLILQGDTTKFTSRFSYRRVGIVGTLKYANVEMRDTAWVYIKPGMAFRLVLEPKGMIDSTKSNPLDTLSISAREQSASVYAVYRDQFGNFIRFATISHWVSLDTSIVTVRKGDTLFGEGIITRNPAARGSIAKVYAVDAYSGARDTFVVKLFSVEYLQMVIITGPVDVTLPYSLDTLRIPANEQSASVYTAYRDQYGNFVRYVTISHWRSLDTSIVTVHKGDSLRGECIVTRKTAVAGSIARIIAMDSASGFIDTCMVKIIPETGLRSATSSARPNRIQLSTSAGVARIHIPLGGTHLIKVYSLSGSVVSSLRTNANDAQVRLPRGVFIVRVQTEGSAERFEAKVFNQ